MEKLSAIASMTEQALRDNQKKWQKKRRSSAVICKTDYLIQYVISLMGNISIGSGSK